MTRIYPTLSMTPFITWALLGVFVLTLSFDLRASETRYAIVVGNNLGSEDDGQLHYAEDDARKIHRVLLDIGGFEPENVHLLLGASANEVREKLMEIDVVSSRSDRPLVLFYYSGHGDEESLHLNGSLLPLSDVHDFIRHSNKSIKIALVDSCRSGALVRTKGAKIGPAVDLDVLRTSNVAGSIVISSSGAQEVSQESDQLGGSFFTHYWVAGLYGQADENQDGVVTLDEAYRFSHYQTVTQTIQSKAGVQHPSYLFRLNGQNSIVLSNLHRNTAQITIASGGENGRYFVVDSLRKIVLTEVVRNENQIRGIRLPPGRYQVRKREKSGLRSVEFQLDDGERKRLTDDDMQVEAYDLQTEKGKSQAGKISESFLSSVLPSKHEPVFSMGLRSPLVKEMTMTPEIQIGHRVNWSYAFMEPRVVLRGAGLGADSISVVHTEMDVGAAAGPRYQWRILDIAAGIDGGAILLSQRKIPSIQDRVFSSGPQGFLTVAMQTNGFIECGLHAGWGLRLYTRGYGGLAFFSMDSLVQPIPQFGAAIGAGYVF